MKIGLGTIHEFQERQENFDYIDFSLL